MRHFQQYIDGCFEDGTASFPSIDPATGEQWATMPEARADDVDRAVEAAHRALYAGAWAAMTPTARGKLLMKLSELVASNAQSLAEVETRDTGKIIRETAAQIAYVADYYAYYAGLADKIEGAHLPIDKADMEVWIRREPVGVVAAIVPWNSQLFLTAVKLGPALAAGCTVVLKASEDGPAPLLEFARLVHDAGFPPGVVNVVTGFGADVGAPLVEHPLVAKVAFTGSDLTGQRIYEAAARGLKHVTMELGGKSPNIVFDDAEIDNAVKGAISGIFAATGQTCIAGSRLLVQQSIHDEFLDKLVAFAKTAKMGNPMSADTQIGPVTNKPQFEKILKYIDIAKGEGARAVLGGARAERPECGSGWFVEPTIFEGVNNRMRIAQEEVFGPVLSVIPFKDEEEAIAIGNDVVYGLAAGVWTQNMRRALTMADRLQAGTVWINTYRAVSYLSPFGGYKRSGIGRESGQDMIKEYLQVKSVWISTATTVPNPFIQR